MKTIGFIDYYLSEWHADNYPAWIKEQSEKLGLNYQVKYAWAKKDVSERDGITTDQWCQNMDVQKCATVKELCKKSDFVIILAPSNPEEHLPLVKEAFPYLTGKRIYIDKTFSPDFNTAKEIFDLAKKYHITFFSSSALRYSDEIKDHFKCEKAITFGGGGNFEEYIIHQIEMIVKTMGTNILRAKTLNKDNGNVCIVEFNDGRNAEMNYSPVFDFKVQLNKNGKEYDLLIASDFFKTLMDKIILFFEKGEIDFDCEQTLAAMALREAVIKSKNNNEVWVKL